ncbi:MAG: hypothetical protein IT371_09460 [Deltaproteobacteria bacterium]|nr:hypothetical protein [Deltaproteobacteria bacterium]
MSSDESSALQADLAVVEGAVRLVLKGQIDEGADLDPLAKRLLHALTKAQLGRVIIDTFDVARINSCGVREWINFMRSVEQVPRLTLSRCSPAIVVQLNSVFNFPGKAEVESVVAPYYCARCDREAMIVVDVPQQLKDPAELLKEPRTCETCKQPLQFDDIPDRYFLFVKFRGQI